MVLVFSVFVLRPVFISGFLVVFVGRRIGNQIASLLGKIFICGFLLAVGTGVVFRVYYIGEIKSQGCVECQSKKNRCFFRFVYSIRLQSESVLASLI